MTHRNPRVLITGSRGFSDLALVDAFVDGLEPDVIVVVGDADGVDTRAKARAEQRGLTVDPHPVTEEEWRLLGRRAGPARNRRMLDTLHRGDRVQAFWDGQSPGTRGTVEMAKEPRRGLRIDVIERR